MNEPLVPGPDPAAGEPALTDPAVVAPPDVAAIPTDPGDVALLALVDRLAAVLDRSDLAELEVQVGGTGLVLRKPVAAPVAAPAVAVPGVVATEAGTAGPGPATAPARPSIKAPLTGIWYGSPSPGSGPYVVEGGEVAVGQVIGLIEAMKLFNEIKSDLAGRVGKVHAENGMLVKAKQPLIEVEPL
jgi:acetyl-CoA carboxylase biotin carboxyl carrier protein